MRFKLERKEKEEKQAHLRQPESGHTRRRDAKRETSEEPRVIAHAADGEDEIDLLVGEGSVGGHGEGDGFARFAELGVCERVDSTSV